MITFLDVLIFELKNNLGHFRRPDTTVTHATYPFIPRTVLHGLLASILGLKQLEGENWIGIRLLNSVKTCTQQMSMLGKGWIGGGKDFNRPTTIELVVQPHYRIYYTGFHIKKLSDAISQGYSYYHTYLGSAYCLTFPRYIDLTKAKKMVPDDEEKLVCQCVVPSHAIKELIPYNGANYGRVGGMHYQHLGERRFRDAINLIYEVNGGPLIFKPSYKTTEKPYYFYNVRTEETICLW